MRYYVEYMEYGNKYSTIVSAPSKERAEAIVLNYGMFVSIWKVKEL